MTKEAYLSLILKEHGTNWVSPLVGATRLELLCISMLDAVVKLPRLATDNRCLSKK